MRYLTAAEIIELYRLLMAVSGGTVGILSIEALESAAAQPRMTFGREELYPDVVAKAAALGFSLIMDHPFLDGKKRAGHAAMEIFLVLNGLELVAPPDEQEKVMLQVASGNLGRDEFTAWLRLHVQPLK